MHSYRPVRSIASKVHVEKECQGALVGYRKLVVDSLLETEHPFAVWSRNQHIVNIDEDICGFSPTPANVDASFGLCRLEAKRFEIAIKLLIPCPRRLL